MAFYLTQTFLAPHRAAVYVFVNYFSNMGGQLDLQFIRYHYPHFYNYILILKKFLALKYEVF